MQRKHFFYFLLPLIPALLFFGKLNNTCNSYLGYFNIFFSSDCYYVADLNESIFEIIQRHVGFSETHEVETEDGYILGLFRIPRENPKGVILLDHPISHDARIWVAQYNDSIAFQFWRAGYDVWLSNSRGTFYSRKHKTLTTDDPEFWNFSFHEMGYYDHHAVTRYIREKTNGSKITNVGFSMGATKSLVYASLRPEEAAESNRKTLIKLYLIFFFKEFFNFNFYTSFAQHDIWYIHLARVWFMFCPFKKIVSYTSSIFFGWNPDEFDPSLVNMFAQTLTFETSLKTYSHFNQIFVNGGCFRMYDYGDEENLKIYGSRKPPLYPVEKIKVPVFLFYAEKDTLSSPKDNEALYELLTKEARLGKLQQQGFNHVDFLFGKRRNETFKTILRVLDKRNNGHCKNMSINNGISCNTNEQHVL